MKKIKLLFIVCFVGYLLFTLVMTLALYKNEFKENYLLLEDAEEYKKSAKYDKLVLIKDNIESTLNDRVYSKPFYIDMYGLFQKSMFKRIVGDVDSSKRVIKMKNGKLTFAYSNKDVSKYAKKITNLYNFAKQSNIYMAYINIPWRVPDNNELPFYVEDNVARTNSKMLRKLRANNVNIIDLEKSLTGDYNSWFYDTDHHWKTETAFEAYQIIAKELADNLKYDIPDDYLTNFNKEVYKDIFLGTYGKRVGKWYAGVDDYAYILPNFDTKFEVTNYRDAGKVEDKRAGSFKETMTYPEFLEIKGVDREMSTYYTYSKGTKAEIIVKNLNSYNDKKLLVLKDSFADCTYPFLSLNFKETRVLDIRRYKNIKLYSYIKKYKPDAILILQNAQSLYDETLIQFKEL